MGLPIMPRPMNPIVGCDIDLLLLTLDPQRLGHHPKQQLAFVKSYDTPSPDMSPRLLLATSVV
jgi:hypothetical protein